MNRGVTWTLVWVDLPHRRVGLGPAVDDPYGMSSVAYPPQAARRRAGIEGVTRVLEDHGSDVLLGVVVAALTVVLLADVAKDFDVDSWLAIVTGRAVWHTGIPHRDTLSAITLGHRWTDQQWLSQLASYAIYRLGGLGVLGIVNVALITGSFGAAVLAARRFGAPFRSVLVALPLCVLLISPSRAIRTQELAMPLFVATAYMLAADSRARSRRVFWVLPVLALWANLHGSATLGATLILLYCATLLWERRRELTRSVHAWGRPVALAVGAVTAMLITPYGLHIVGYYYSTMVNGTLRQFVSEWQPVTSSTVVTIALFATVGLALWSFGRNPAGTTLWEKLGLLVLAAGSIEVVRNAVFLGFVALIVLPLSLGWGPTQSSSADRLRARINGTGAAVALVAVIGAGIIVATRPSSAIAFSGQSPRMLAAVERVTRADPSLRLLVDDRYSDFLLWRDPALAGRIATDVRFELLAGHQLQDVENALTATGPDFKRGARGYRLLVLNRAADAGGITGFLREPGRRVIYSDSQQVVILRSAREADVQ